MIPETIINQLHTVLYPIAPILPDRERLIGEIGETIWLEALEKVLLALDEPTRAKAVELLNNDELDEATLLFVESNIDVESILRTTAENVLDDVFKVATSTGSTASS